MRPSTTSALKVTSAILLVLILIGLAFLLLRDRPATTNTVSSSAYSNNETQNMNADSVKDQIAAIVSLAREGQVETSGFIVGETTQNEVVAKWRTPEQTSENGGMVFAEYPANFATFGYRDDIAIDLRSDDPALQKIHYLDLLAELGDADRVTTYSDDAVDQIILGYDLPGGYTLRWIFPKPWSGSGNETETAGNPVLDHISLLGPAKNAAADAPDVAVPAKPEHPADTADSPSDDSAQAASDDSALKPSEEVTALLDNMTLDEKIGQMIVAGVEGTSLREEDRTLLHDHGVGGVILYADNIDSAAQTKSFVNEIKAANREKELPLFISVDQEGGRVARLKGVAKVPTAGKVGKENDAAYARSIGELLGDQLLSQGFNLDYAPVLDVNSNPDNPVIGDRSFGSSAALVSKLGIAVMQGLESKNVIPVVKHFPGHGDTSVDSHIALPVVNKSLDELDKLELIPFKKAIAEGADVVMIAHILLPKLDSEYPSSLSKAVITDLLRSRLGFDGVVMTDDMTMGAIAENYGLGEASVHSVQAGSDILLVAHRADNAIAAIEAVKQAVAEGKISEKRIDESVARIVALKQKYLLNN
ncbi:hypothetical protein GCM10007362_32590 [Saccharibacillus endophyticus]|uniref:beta-N-acetylhexosaminidase n=2 Tax=Saccharibacillus endophyticus TaxID=2060666 RepID=A0ABQ1ZXQ3_9BACL|nr:hypothetical protein GCM10007362_32590 [Saccharibacillus endophyticus]